MENISRISENRQIFCDNAQTAEPCFTARLVVLSQVLADLTDAMSRGRSFLPFLRKIPKKSNGRKVHKQGLYESGDLGQQKQYFL